MKDEKDLDMDAEEPTVFIVCSGPPYCDLLDEEALKAQEKGCIWCAKIYEYEDGRQILEQPGDA